MRYLFFNNKGGVGKTTLATHLFRTIASFRPCCLLDLDEQQDGLRLVSGHQWDGRSPTIGLGQHRSGRVIATCDLDVAQDRDPLVVDAPPRREALEVIGKELGLGSEDRVIIPIRGRLSIEGALRVIEDAEALGCEVILVLNRTEPRAHVADHEIEQARRTRATLYPKVIPETDMIREAELMGKAAWEMDWSRNTNGIPHLRLFCYYLARGVLDDGNVYGLTNAQQERISRFELS